MELAVTVEPVEVQAKEAFREGLDAPASSFKEVLTVYFTYRVHLCTEVVAEAVAEDHFMVM
jgi:hypothetical protein